MNSRYASVNEMRLQNKSFVSAPSKCIEYCCSVVFTLYIRHSQLDAVALDGVLPCSVIRMKASGKCHVSVNKIRDGLALPHDLGDLGDDIEKLDLSL